MMDNLRATPATGLASLLDRLPLQDPDPALWERIQLARSRQQWRRRLHQRRWLGGSLAAAAALLVVLLPRVIDAPENTGAATDWQASSQALEQEWQAGAHATMDPRFRAELNLIDLQLQAAYDRGAEPAELASLWRLRSEALQELLRSHSEPMLAVTRI